MGNQSPSMRTWQIDTYVNWEVLAEIIHQTGIGHRIDWDDINRRTAEKYGVDDDGDRRFLDATVDGIRKAVAAQNGGV